MRKYYYTDDIVLTKNESALSGISVPTRYDIRTDAISDIDMQITYKFTSDTRVNMFPVGNKRVSYGSPNMTFRRLYLLLVEKYNNGVFFIERYFEDVYPSTVKFQVQWRISQIQREYEVEQRELNRLAQANIAVSTGLPDKRFNNTINLLKFVSGKNKFVQEKSAEIATIIKQDIQQCFSLGMVGFNFVLADETIKRRKKAGLDSNIPFYASGQLIKNILIFLRFEVNE